jgi:hypothetical protein
MDLEAVAERGCRALDVNPLAINADALVTHHRAFGKVRGLRILT